MSVSFARSFPRAFIRSYGTVQSSPTAASFASRIPPALQEAVAATAPRTNWTRDEVQQIYETPLNQLTYAAVCFDLPAALGVFRSADILHKLLARIEC
jgi:biotin synthase